MVRFAHSGQEATSVAQSLYARQPNSACGLVLHHEVSRHLVKATAAAVDCAGTCTVSQAYADSASFADQH